MGAVTGLCAKAVPRPAHRAALVTTLNTCHPSFDVLRSDVRGSHIRICDPDGGVEPETGGAVVLTLVVASHYVVATSSNRPIHRLRTGSTICTLSATIQSNPGRGLFPSLSGAGNENTDAIFQQPMVACAGLPLPPRLLCDHGSRPMATSCRSDRRPTLGYGNRILGHHRRNLMELYSEEMAHRRHQPLSPCRVWSCD